MGYKFILSISVTKSYTDRPSQHEPKLNKYNIHNYLDTFSTIRF